MAVRSFARASRTANVVQTLSTIVFVTLTMTIGRNTPSRCCFAHSLRIDLPGGGRISYNGETGVLRVRLKAPDEERRELMRKISASSSSSTASEAVRRSIEVRDTGVPGKGFGAFVVGDDGLSRHSFLGLYEGEVVRGRERLEEVVRRRARDDDDDDDGAFDYVVSLDGGDTFLDGYERARDRSVFCPAHLNHADRGTDGCNCFRVLGEEEEEEEDGEDLDGKVAFFTARDVSVGEELCFDYGDDFWVGREERKIP